MSHSLYSKQRGGNHNTTPLSRCKDCDFTLVPVVISTVLKEGFVVQVAHGSFIKLGEDVTDVMREVGV